MSPAPSGDTAPEGADSALPAQRKKDEALEEIEPPEEIAPNALQIEEVKRYSTQTAIGFVIALVTLTAFFVLVCVASALALMGHTDRIGPLLQALEPYLLPLLGGIVGYAFGKQSTPDS